MTKNTWFAIWGVLFILCACLGFIPAPGGMLRLGMTLVSLVFFLPPAVLLWQAGKAGERHTILLIRNLSAASLGITVAVLTVNFLGFMATEAVGNMLYAILVIVSSPMVCSQYWALSLFLWACLMMASRHLLKK